MSKGSRSELYQHSQGTLRSEDHGLGTLKVRIDHRSSRGPRHRLSPRGQEHLLAPDGLEHLAILSIPTNRSPDEVGGSHGANQACVSLMSDLTAVSASGLPKSLPGASILPVWNIL